MMMMQLQDFFVLNRVIYYRTLSVLKMEGVPHVMAYLMCCSKIPSKKIPLTIFHKFIRVVAQLLCSSLRHFSLAITSLVMVAPPGP